MDAGLLIARLVFGALMAAHGAQKLFGWFGGHGLAGTAPFFESLGFRPGRAFALAAALSEAGGGAPERPHSAQALGFRLRAPGPEPICAVSHRDFPPVLRLLCCDEIVGLGLPRVVAADRFGAFRGADAHPCFDTRP